MFPEDETSCSEIYEGGNLQEFFTAGKPIFPLFKLITILNGEPIEKYFSINNQELLLITNNGISSNQN